MANATPALQAAQSATNEIPVLGTSVTEYGVALGLTDFDGTVGGNISGTSDLAPLDQQAEMIVEWMPEAKKVGLLYCSAEANSQYQVDEVQKYLEEKGVTATQYAFSDSNDLSSVCQKAADENDALYVPTDNTVAANTGIVDGICRPAKKPVFAGEEGICSGCGVATLSISYYDLGVTTGKMAAQILTGEADISTMPIAYAENFTPKFNTVIGEALGIAMSDKKNIITPFRHHSFTFLKMRVTLTETGKVVMKLSRKSIRAMRRKMDIFRRWMDEGRMGPEDVFQSYQSWRAHAKRCNSYDTLRAMDERFTQMFAEELAGRRKPFPCTMKATRTGCGWIYRRHGAVIEEEMCA